MKKSIIFLFLIFVLPFLSSAHYVVGIANDALDGTSADGFEVVLWNPANGIADNLTDVVGQEGNSGQDNFYLIDCEMLATPCSIGDSLNVKIFSYPFSEETGVTITGSGFDLAENLTLNSAPSFVFLVVDDSYQFPIFPENEIDLFANSVREVFCEAVIEDLDGDKIQNISGEFFDNSLSFFGDSNDYNYHYLNNSCFINETYSENQILINCSFEVRYNANYGEWNCTIFAEDNLSSGKTGSDITNVNQLLSIGVEDFIGFGNGSGETVSNESIMNITNFGNVVVNLSLSGYGSFEGDGYSMVCGAGEIPIQNMKYNLTSSTTGDLSLEDFEETYINLTSSSVIKEFNLDYRQDEVFNEAVNSTFWRVYVPLGVSGGCSGNIAISAFIGEGE